MSQGGNDVGALPSSDPYMVTQLYEDIPFKKKPIKIYYVIDI
jgi:hypothetical protein